MWVEHGGVAQLGEHLLCKQGVVGSNPIVSTSFTTGVMAAVSADVSQRRVGIRCCWRCVETALAAPVVCSFGLRPEGVRPRWGCDVLCQGESGSGASLGATYRKV